MTDRPLTPEARELRKHLLAMVVDAGAPASIMRTADPFLDRWQPRIEAAVRAERDAEVARLRSLLRDAATNWHDFGRGHQPGPRSADADKRVFFSQCQLPECVAVRAILAQPGATQVLEPATDSTPLPDGGGRKFPAQNGAPIPWSLAERAYAVYASRYGRAQSLERLAERGGFGINELDDLVPGWRTLLPAPITEGAAGVALPSYITGDVLDQWEASARADADKDEPWSVNPNTLLAILPVLRAAIREDR